MRPAARDARRVPGERTSDIETPALFELEAREHLGVALYGYTKVLAAMQSAIDGTDEAYSWDGREATRAAAEVLNMGTGCRRA